MPARGPHTHGVRAITIRCARDADESGKTRVARTGDSAFASSAYCRSSILPSFLSSPAALPAASPANVPRACLVQHARRCRTPRAARPPQQPGSHTGYAHEYASNRATSMKSPSCFPEMYDVSVCVPNAQASTRRRSPTHGTASRQQKQRQVSKASQIGCASAAAHSAPPPHRELWYVQELHRCQDSRDDAAAPLGRHHQGRGDGGRWRCCRGTISVDAR